MTSRPQATPAPSGGAAPPVPAVPAEAPGAGRSSRPVAAIVGVLALAVFMSSLDLFASCVNTSSAGHRRRSGAEYAPAWHYLN